MSKTVEEILAPKPEARARIYAYSIDDKPHAGLLKVGQTTRDVKQRVAEQLKTAAIKNYKIELDQPAERNDGTTFSDHEVRAALVRKGFENPELEWVRCSVKDVKTVVTELHIGQRFTGTHHQTFKMRREQIGRPSLRLRSLKSPELCHSAIPPSRSIPAAAPAPPFRARYN